MGESGHEQDNISKPSAHLSGADAKENSNKFVETTDFGREATPGQSSETTDAHTPVAFGRYEVRKQIGQGGFGAVYEGFDPQLKRRVAIKARSADSTRKVDEQAFLQEARQLAQLSHNGIVTVYDVGLQDGRCYIVSDFLEGPDLSHWLRDNFPSWQRAARIVADLADALGHAHAHRIVHRDVKPENVIMKDGNTPVLVDFGLAISDVSDAGGERGRIAGTPHYMSPEQTAGRGHRIDGRTDIYSLGVVLYRMLCGRAPFHADDVREILRQVREDLPQPPRQLVADLPIDVEKICLKAMAKRPDDRYTTAIDLANELRGVLEGQSESFETAVLSVSEPLEKVPTDQLPSSVRRAREAERRQVTVVYCECNVFDSMEFLENLDPDEQHELLSEYQQLCQRSVSQFGGTTVQSTGQSLLVCFGYPLAYEDSARRAVHTGLEILSKIDELNERFQDSEIKVSPWIAVHTGVVIAKEALDEFAPEPMSIVGEARSVATQLKVAAVPGAVVVSQATQRLIAGYFDCESVGTHSIPGASKPVEVLRVIGETAAKTRIDVAEPSGLTPLIGRDTEVSILRERWEQASEAMGQIVLLIGDAGLGKSRLVHEIRQHVAGDEQKGQVVEWRCSPYHQNSSFYPAIDFFGRLLNFRHDDTPADRLEKLVEHLRENNLDDQEIVPLFAQLLSVPLDSRYSPLGLGPQRLKEMTQQALLDWLREFSVNEPVLFILEDLHWLDPTTLEFVTLLIEQGMSDSVMSLLTFRPEFVTPWTSMAHQTQVALNRLTRRQIGEMMRVKTGVANLPESIVEQIADRTDGVPLFVEEFTRVIQESGQLQEVDGQTQIAASFSLDTIPSTLQDLLVSRLDRMDSAHDVVQLGATIGREFSHELIDAVFDDEETDLQTEIDKLVKSELLVQRGRPPRCKYMFKHVLIQDAAYQSLLKKKRQNFHQKIASKIEELFSETLETEPELVAFHFSEGGVGDKAIPLWLAAGQRSLARSAVAEAINHLTQGLKLIDKMEDGPHKIQLELGFRLPLGMALIQAKGYATNEVGETFQRARELCEQLGPGSPLFYVLWGMWVWHLVRNELNECELYANELMQLAESTGDDGLIMEACFNKGLVKFYTGEFDEAREILERGLSLHDIERCQQHFQFTGQDCGVGTLIYLALTLWALGYPDQALKRGEEAIELAEKIKHPFTHAFALYHFGWLLHYLELGHRIEQLGDEGRKLSYEQGFPLWETLSMLNQGAGQIMCGNPEAFDLMHAGLDGFQATGAMLHSAHCYGLFAGLHCRNRNLDRVAEELEKGFKTARECNELCDEAYLYCLQGDLAWAKFEDEIVPEAESEAESCYQKSLEIARRQNAKSWQLRTTISFCRFRKRQGRLDETGIMLREILDWFTEGHQSHDLVVAKAILDELA